MGDTPFCTFYKNSSTRMISIGNALEYLQQVAEVIGKDKLGFKPYQIGMYSI